MHRFAGSAVHTGGPCHSLQRDIRSGAVLTSGPAHLRLYHGPHDGGLWQLHRYILCAHPAGRLFVLGPGQIRLYRVYRQGPLEGLRHQIHHGSHCFHRRCAGPGRCEHVCGLLRGHAHRLQHAAPRGPAQAALDRGLGGGHLHLRHDRALRPHHAERRGDKIPGHYGGGWLAGGSYRLDTLRAFGHIPRVPGGSPGQEEGRAFYRPA